MIIVAIVIWFNPSPQFVVNIQTYAKLVSKVLVIDNSRIENSSLLTGLANAEYRWLGRNLGVATALNVGCRRALQLGAAWVLTMDQDSSFDSVHIKEYLNPHSAHFSEANVAVFGPGLTQSYAVNGDCNSVITSGSLISMAAYTATSGFNDLLFIDQVDHEFCCRLKRMGFRVVRVIHVLMRHSVGCPLQKTFLGRTISSANHPAVRKYYITRNTLYMRRHYPEFGRGHVQAIVLDLIKIALLEADKLNKFAHVIRGWLDHHRGRTGPLSE